MNILYVFADSPSEWNCSEWRCLAPSNAINRVEGHKARLLHVGTFDDYLHPGVQDAVAPADLIIFQRNLIHPPSWDAIQYWKGMGKVIAADLDDAYQMLPHSNPAHKFWIDNSRDMDPDPIKALEKGLSMCDGLLAPNRLLLMDWEHVVPGFYLPNYARDEWWEDLPDRETLKRQRGLEGKVVIGWGGSVSHYDGWWGSGLREALAGICDKHDNVVVLVCGNDPRLYAQLPVPAHKKLMQRGVPPEEWPKTVRCFDIGVAPLFGLYDQRRSWIKGLEYMLAEVPWIGTEGEPYRALSAYGALIPNGERSWFGALHAMIQNLGAAQEAAHERLPFAKELCVNGKVESIIATYEQIHFLGRAKWGMLPGLSKAPEGEPEFDGLSPPFGHYSVHDIPAVTPELLSVENKLSALSKSLIDAEIAGVPVRDAIAYDFIQIAGEEAFVQWANNRSK